MERKEKKLELKCILTALEKIEKGEEMSELIRDKNILEGEKKATASSYKSRIEDKELQISEITGVLRDGYEFRDVECEEVFDYEENKARIYRLDTGELVKERLLEPHERQMSIISDEEGMEPESERADNKIIRLAQDMAGEATKE